MKLFFTTTNDGKVVTPKDALVFPHLPFETGNRESLP